MESTLNQKVVIDMKCKPIGEIPKQVPSTQIVVSAIARLLGKKPKAYSRYKAADGTLRIYLYFDNMKARLILREVMHLRPNEMEIERYFSVILAELCVRE